MEIHRQEVGSASHVHLIAYTARPVEWSIGFTDEQARQLVLALMSCSSISALCALRDEFLASGGCQIVCTACEAPFSPFERVCPSCGSIAIVGRPAGALGKNTDTDSHPGARYERQGDCRLSAEPMLPLGGVQ
jgi:hypothetical protein